MSLSYRIANVCTGTVRSPFPRRDASRTKARFLLTALAGLGVSGPLQPAIAALATEEIPTGRLPGTAVPLDYQLDLTIRPEEARFSGKAAIAIALKTPTRLLWINGKHLAVTRVDATIGKRVIEGRYREVDPNGVARIDFDQPLPAGRVGLVIQYDAAFGESDHGLYHLKVGDRWYAWTNDEPTDARSVFPSFDEPGFKTPYQITVSTSPGNTVISNVPDAAITRRGDLEVHRFASTYPLSSYLVAVAVGPFAKVDATIPPTPERPHPLPLRVFATAGLADRLPYPAANTGWFVQQLEGFFGSPFPYRKLDLVSSPAMDGGMENAGIVMDDDVSLLFANGGRIRTQQSFAILQAHELAHQWFGDLVSPAWWTDSWLNESFAEWLGIAVGSRWRPELGVRARGYESVLQSMALDQLTAGRPVHVRFTNTLVDASLDPITYGKGAQVIGMIEDFLGPETFRQGVRLHISRHLNGNATAEDFYGALADASHRPELVAAMRSFIDQPGLPVLTFTRGEGRLRVAQSRYVPIGSPPPPPTSWMIPLCLRQGTARTCRLMDSQEMTLPDTSATLVPNADGNGYYRFNLPDADWHGLIAEAPKLSLGEAMMTIDSLWAAFAAGKASAALLIDATSRFATFDDASVVEASAAQWDRLMNSGWFNRGERPAIEAMLRRAYEAQLATLGFDPMRVPGGDAQIGDRRLRSTLVKILAKNARSMPVRQKLFTAAQAYLSGNDQALHVDYLEAGLGVYFQEEGLEQAKSAFESVIAASDAGKRQAIFDAIASSDNMDIAGWLLTRLNDPRIVTRERQGIVMHVLEMERTRAGGLAWLQSDASRTQGVSPLWRTTLQAPFCSTDDADAIATMSAPARRDPRRNLAIDRALERIRSCAALRSSRHDDIVRAVAAASRGTQ